MTHSADPFSEPFEQMPSEEEQTIFWPAREPKNPSIRERGQTDGQTQIEPPRKTETTDDSPRSKSNYCLNKINEELKWGFAQTRK